MAKIETNTVEVKARKPRVLATVSVAAPVKSFPTFGPATRAKHGPTDASNTYGTLLALLDGWKSGDDNVYPITISKRNYATNYVRCIYTMEGNAFPFSAPLRKHLEENGLRIVIAAANTGDEESTIFVQVHKMEDGENTVSLADGYVLRTRKAKNEK